MTAARFVAALLGIAVVVSGCSDDDDRLEADDSFIDESGSAVSTTTSTVPVEVPPPVGDRISLDLDLPRRVPAAAFEWTIELEAEADEPVTVTFGSSQQVEIVITDDDGTELHRWSDGRFFTQAVTTVDVGVDEPTVLTVADDLTGIEPGYYEVEVTLVNTEPPEPVTASIRIVAPPES